MISAPFIYSKFFESSEVLFYISYIIIWAGAWQNQQNDMRLVTTQISLGIHPDWSVFAVYFMDS